MSRGLGSLVYPHIRSSGVGRGGGGGGGGAPAVENYLNIASAASYPIQPVYTGTSSNPIGAGGFMPGVNGGYASGGALRVTVSFWFRLNAQVGDAFNTPLVTAYNHDQTDGNSTWGIFLRRWVGATSGIYMRWAKLSPWYNFASSTIPAASLGKLFDTSHTVRLNKWIFVYAEMGNSVGCLVGDSDGVDSWVGGSGASTIANHDSTLSLRAGIGSSGYDGENYAYGTPRMDICNLRVGITRGPSAAWWSNEYWKKQIDVSAEWDAMVADGYTLAEAKQAVSYGYPLQDDLAEESGVGGSFNHGSNSSLIPVVGDAPPIVA